MVTAGSAQEADVAWMSKLLRAGMNVVRINCAHEGPDEWHRIVEALTEARLHAGVECRVLMDLAGPKIRTGPIAVERRVATWRPERDDIGMVTAPARIVVHRAAAPLPEDAASPIAIDGAAFPSLRPGDELRFRDARGKCRSLEICEIGPDALVALATERAYVLDRAEARIFREGTESGVAVLTVIGGATAAIDVRPGDSLVLTARRCVGRPPRRDAEGQVLTPGLVACTLPAALERLAVGHRVLFDDGKIEAIVVERGLEQGDFVLRVARTQKPVVKLRAEKGINLPDTDMSIDALTPEDIAALEVAAKHADAVGLSFVRRPEDVRRLHEELDRLGRPDIGVILKIETKAGFESLPRLLLEGLRRPPLGVMIARGDLAVEVGFERLAELQEEILWLCEASHVPAIWATQVLDTLARTGIPSRAEVTDAAASVAAECVMLNKGPFIDDAVRVLTDILRRMERHRYKKRSLFRKLHVSTIAER
jgi:pyruvate kinase